MKACQENVLISAFRGVYRHLTGALGQSRGRTAQTTEKEETSWAAGSLSRCLSASSSQPTAQQTRSGSSCRSLTPTDGPGLQRLLGKAFLQSFLEMARDVDVTVL